VDVLNEFEIKATFFALGTAIADNPDLASVLKYAYECMYATERSWTVIAC
jgi:hypothetical protein